MAVTNIIAPSEMIEAWIHNKNDFFTMIVTFVVTLTFDTSLGLAVGIGMSALMLIKGASDHVRHASRNRAHLTPSPACMSPDIIFSPDSKPFYELLPSAQTMDAADGHVDDVEGVVKEDKNSEGGDGGDGGEEGDPLGVKDVTVQVVRLNNDLVFLTAPAIKDTLVDELLNKRGHRFEALVLDFSDVKITGALPAYVPLMVAC